MKARHDSKPKALVRMSHNTSSIIVDSRLKLLKQGHKTDPSLFGGISTSVILLRFYRQASPFSISDSVTTKYELTSHYPRMISDQSSKSKVFRWVWCAHAFSVPCLVPATKLRPEVPLATRINDNTTDTECTLLGDYNYGLLDKWNIIVELRGTVPPCPPPLSQQDLNYPPSQTLVSAAVVMPASKHVPQLLKISKSMRLANLPSRAAYHNKQNVNVAKCCYDQLNPVTIANSESVSVTADMPRNQGPCGGEKLLNTDNKYVQPVTTEVPRAWKESVMASTCQGWVTTGPSEARSSSDSPVTATVVRHLPDESAGLQQTHTAYAVTLARYILQIHSYERAQRSELSSRKQGHRRVSIANRSADRVSKKQVLPRR